MAEIEKFPDTPPSLVQRIRLVIVGSVQEWVDQRAASKGAALAFYTVFSMAPILILVIAIAGAIFGEKAAQGAIYAQLNGLLGAGGAEAIQLLLAGARNPQAGVIATLIATVVLLIGATTAFAELKDSLDEIWHVPKVRQPGLFGLLRTRLLSFGLILALAFLLLVSLALSAGLAVFERYWAGLWDETSSIVSQASFVFSFVVIASLFATIFKVLPQIKLSWHDVWIGALGTAGLFNLGKYVIGVYLSRADVVTTYGAAGSVIALLLWIYYSAQIFFFGAQFTRQYALVFGSLRNSPPAEKAADVPTSG